MTHELPPLINGQYKTDGKNSVGGLSSTGGTAIDYAIQAPGLYRAVGSYSGFPAVSPNITGGLIERIVADHTKQFADAATAAEVPIKYVVRPEGSHTWGLFESEMQESWNTTIGPPLDA